MRAWHEGWWEMAAETGDLLAPLLGVTPGHVSMHQNVSVAVAQFFSCFDYPPERNRIVYTELNFPSVTYVAAGRAAPRRRDRRRALRRRHRRPHRAAARRHRRAHPPGAGLPHLLQERLRPGRRGDRPPLPRGGGGAAARRLPVHRRRSPGARSLGGRTPPSAARSSGCAADPGRAISGSIPSWRRGWSRRSPAGRPTKIPSPFAPAPSAPPPAPGGSSPVPPTSPPSTPVAPATASSPGSAPAAFASARWPSPAG